MLNWVLVRIAALAGIGGFLFGYDLGLIGGALLAMKSDPNLEGMSTSTKEWIVGTFKMGAVFGTFIGGALMLRYGRRLAIAATCIATVSGPLIMAASTSTSGLVIGRVVGGFGIGAYAVISPTYLAEVAPPEHRGAMVLGYEVMLCFGSLAANLVDWALQGVPGSWRVMVGLPALPAALLVLCMTLMPESPRWLLMRGDAEAARQVLRMLLRKPREGRAERSELESRVEAEVALLHEEMEWLQYAALGRRRTGGPSSSPRPPQETLQLSQLRYLSSLDGSHLDCETGRNHIAASGIGSSPTNNNYTLELTRGNGHTDIAVFAQRLAGSPHQADNPHHYPQYDSNHDPHGDPHQRPHQIPHQQHADGQLRARHPQLDCSSPVNSSSTDRPHRKGRGTVSSSQSEEQLGIRECPSKLRTEDNFLQHPDTTEMQPLIAPDDDDGDDDDGSSSNEGCEGDPLLKSAAATAAAAAGVEAGQGVHKVSNELPGNERSFTATLLVMLKDIYWVATGPERHAFSVALWLAFFNQATASTAVINFAPSLMEQLGSMSDGTAVLVSSSITAIKAAGVITGIFTVDLLGRRPLLIWGAVGCAVAMLAAAGTLFTSASPWATLATLLLFMLSFSSSWAGGFWVVTSEIFSLSAKSPGVSAAAAMLFLSGSLTNLVFMSFIDAAGSFSFIAFALICAAAATYVYCAVPETKGKALGEIQAMLQRDSRT